MTAEEILAPDDPNSPIGDAMDFLRESLSDAPRRQDELMREAADLQISARTLRRAKQRLRVKSCKQGFKGGWLWELPKDANAEAAALWPASLEPVQAPNGNVCDASSEAQTH